MRIPKVPHAVPVEKERNAATAKITAGMIATGKWLASTTDLTYSPVPSTSEQIEPSVHASTRMMFADAIDFTPSVMLSINALNPSRRLGTNSRKATSKAPNPPITSEAEESQLPNACCKVVTSAWVK